MLHAEMSTSNSHVASLGMQTSINQGYRAITPLKRFLPAAPTTPRTPPNAKANVCLPPTGPFEYVSSPASTMFSFQTQNVRQHGPNLSLRDVPNSRDPNSRDPNSRDPNHLLETPPPLQMRTRTPSPCPPTPPMSSEQKKSNYSFVRLPSPQAGHAVGPAFDTGPQIFLPPPPTHAMDPDIVTRLMKRRRLELNKAAFRQHQQRVKQELQDIEDNDPVPVVVVAPRSCSIRSCLKAFRVATPSRTRRVQFTAKSSIALFWPDEAPGSGAAAFSQAPTSEGGSVSPRPCNSPHPNMLPAVRPATPVPHRYPEPTDLEDRRRAQPHGTRNDANATRNDGGRSESAAARNDPSASGTNGTNASGARPHASSVDVQYSDGTSAYAEFTCHPHAHMHQSHFGNSPVANSTPLKWRPINFSQPFGMAPGVLPGGALPGMSYSSMAYSSPNCHTPSAYTPYLEELKKKPINSIDADGSPSHEEKKKTLSDESKKAIDESKNSESKTNESKANESKSRRLGDDSKNDSKNDHKSSNDSRPSDSRQSDSKYNDSKDSKTKRHGEESKRPVDDLKRFSVELKSDDFRPPRTPEASRKKKSKEERNKDEKNKDEKTKEKKSTRSKSSTETKTKKRGSKEVSKSKDGLDSNSLSSTKEEKKEEKKEERKEEKKAKRQISMELGKSAEESKKRTKSASRIIQSP